MAIAAALQDCLGIRPASFPAEYLGTVPNTIESPRDLSLSDRIQEYKKVVRNCYYFVVKIIKCSISQAVAHEGFDAGQRRTKIFGLRSSRLRKIRTPTAAAAHLCSHRSGDIARLQTRH